MPTPARSGCVLDGFAQADQHIAIQLENVPVQPVRDADRVVGKAVHRLDAQLVRAEVAEHHSAAGGPKINSGHPSAGHCVPFDKRRPSPSKGSGHICGLSPSKPGRSPQEGRSDAGVDGNVQTSGVAQVCRAEHEDSVGNVLRQTSRFSSVREA